MNITTSTLLNILSPTINNTIKDKIEKLSVDGKVDIPTLIKDKSIQSLINGLFKDISLGTQTKDSISALLQNNKNALSFKNLSDDIKNLVKFLETKIESKVSSKQENKILNQISALKESIIDIKNIDVKILKENISNSGVFLESKISKDAIPLSKNLEQLVLLIKNKINLLQTMTKNSTSSDLKIELKVAIENILKDIKVIVSQIENKSTGFNENISSKVKSYIQNISTSIKTVETVKNPEQQITLLKNLTSNIELLKNEILNRVNIENNLGLTKNISRDIKMIVLQIQEQISDSNDSDNSSNKDIKAKVEKILSQVEYFQLLSYSSNSNHTYLSFLQENIDDADIKLNSLEDDSVSCQINLTLKKQGELKILMILDKKYNLNINIGVENFNFKEKIQNNLQKLRIKINSIGVILQSLNVFDINQDNNNELSGYKDNKNINFGLDIKA